MKQGLKGNLLPENADEAKQLQQNGTARYSECVMCERNLGEPAAASTPAGWLETQISGLCEPCFDDLFEDEE